MEKGLRLKGKVGVGRGRQQAQSEGRKLVGTESPGRDDGHEGMREESRGARSWAGG